MGEDLWPDMLPEVEEVDTPEGTRWIGLLRDRNDRSVRWRSELCASHAEANKAARDMYFDCFDR